MSLELAVNTSESRAQLLLVKEGIVLSEKFWEKQGSHSEIITDTLTKMLKESQSKVDDLSKIYCVNGPGSFTGIRVGVSFCKALAYSLDCEIVAINALDLLATNAGPSNHKILSVIDAQKNSVFFSIYEGLGSSTKSILRNKVLSISALQEVVQEKFVVCGAGFNNYLPSIEPVITENFILNKKHDLCDLKNIFSNRTLDTFPTHQKWFEFQPLYIKASAPEEKINPTFFGNSTS